MMTDDDGVYPKNNKAIIRLVGSSRAKNIFDEVAKKAGYWVWNVSFQNNLAHVAKCFGRNHTDIGYVAFLERLVKFGRENDFDELAYLEIQARNFMRDERANLMVIHGGVNLPSDEYPYFTVLISDKESPTYDVTIIEDDHMYERILSVLKIITQ